MYFFDNKKHQAPHIHAQYAEYQAVSSIPSGDLLDGDFPNKQRKLVEAWISIHEDELMADWTLAVSGQQPFKINPLS